MNGERRESLKKGGGVLALSSPVVTWRRLELGLESGQGLNVLLTLILTIKVRIILNLTTIDISNVSLISDQRTREMFSVPRGRLLLRYTF